MRKNCNFGLIFIWNERVPPTGLTSTQSFTWLWFSPVTVLSSSLYLKLIGLKRQWHQITINYMNILLFQGFIGSLVEILRPSHSTNSLPFNNKEKAVTFLVWFTVYRFLKLDLRFSFIFCISPPIMIVWMLSKHSSCCWVVKSKYIESKNVVTRFNVSFLIIKYNAEIFQHNIPRTRPQDPQSELQSRFCSVLCYFSSLLQKKMFSHRSRRATKKEMKSINIQVFTKGNIIKEHC